MQEKGFYCRAKLNEEAQNRKSMRNLGTFPLSASETKERTASLLMVLSVIIELLQRSTIKMVRGKAETFLFQLSKIRTRGPSGLKVGGVGLRV